MPIYAYRCTQCNHPHDALRKISDPPLLLCPACGKDVLVKQVTAAGFALKGTGWYVTDFRGGDGSGANSGTATAPTTATPATSAAPSAPAAASPAPATTSTPSTSP